MATYEYTEYSWIVNRDTGETMAIIPSTGGEERQVARLENGAVERLVEAHAELGESAWEAHAFLGGYIDQMGPEAADIWQRLGIALAALENEPTQ
jgi:hypothetical protein